MNTDRTTFNTNHIKVLIDAFYNGETSVEQEKYLLNYFENENVAEELLGEKEIFLRMYQAEDIEVPEHLDTKLSNLIDQLAGEEKSTTPVYQIKPDRKKMWIWMSSAACIIILVAAGFLLNESRNTGRHIVASSEIHLKDTYTDPGQAQAEAEKALILVSSNFNKGIDQLSMVSANLQKTGSILDKSLSSIK